MTDIINLGLDLTSSTTITTPVLGATVTLGGSGASGATGASGSGAGSVGVVTPVVDATATLGGSGSGSLGDGASGAGSLSGGATVGIGDGAGSGSGSSSGDGSGAGGTGAGGGSTGGGGSGSAGGSTGAGGSGGATGGAGAGATGGSGGTSGGASGGGAATVGPAPDPATALANIFHLGSSSEAPASVQAQVAQLQQQVTAGVLTAGQAVLKIADLAIGTTSLAVTSYQFFTGLTPTAEGLAYLTHSASNPNDLSDSYYSAFNTENRYINFASNLGLHSDAAASFAQGYGALSFQQTVAKAYSQIVGIAEATQAGIDPQAAIADIVSRQGYFQAVAHERFGTDNQDLSTKLAAVAYILEESVKADVGRYGHAEQNFLFDLADGKAQFHVDLVGTYGGLAQPTNFTT